MLLVLKLFFLTPGLVFLVKVLLLLLEGINMLAQLIVLFLQSLDAIVHVRLRLIGNEGLLQTIRNRAVIKLLQSAFDHACLVPHSHELVTALNTVKRDLADDLVKALRVEFFTDRADAIRARIESSELLVETLLEVDNIGTGGRCRGNVTHPKLIVLDHFLRW